MNVIIKKLKRIVKNSLARLGIRIIKLKYYPEISNRKIIENFADPQSISVIFDVGANVGQSALEFKGSYPESTIYSFEPFSENFEKLKEKASRVTGIVPNKIALSNRTETNDVFRDLNLFSEWNSLEPITQKLLAESDSKRSENIQIEKGDDFCARNNISKIDLLKIDTEGHDLAVLEGFSDMLRNKAITFIFVECGFLNDNCHSNFTSVFDFLRNNNLLLAGFYETCIFESGRCEYTNALFIRSDLQEVNG